MGRLSVLDPKKGDVKIVWDSDNEDEVALAEKQFKEAQKKKFTAYAVKGKGKKGEKLEEFDPDLERIIMVPPAVGA